MELNRLHGIPTALQGDAKRLFSVSPYFLELMKTADKADDEAIFKPLETALLPENNTVWFSSCDSSDVNLCLHHLRRLKRQSMRYIIWWELGIHGDIERSYHAITSMAEALLQQAIVMAQRLLQPRFGCLEDGKFCVIGLGKLGGRELNLGSDVDPLFVWQADGQTMGGRKSVAAGEYYNHLSRMLIRLMSEYAVGGVVWPVDMRLRPGGDGAAICLSLDASLSHYLEYGQTWERAMLIKARAVAGDLALGAAFIEGVRPFVYRRYLDYSSVAALAEMKQRINQQAGSKTIEDGFDVKRGLGGIREIEFIIQSMQLLHAGRCADLRQSEGKAALKVLQSQHFIAQDEAEGLFESYVFWRRIEHAIQARKGEQTHALPEHYEAYLSQALQLDNIVSLMQQHQDYVGHVFMDRVLPMQGEDLANNLWLTKHGLVDQVALNETSKALMKQSLEQIDHQLSRGLLPERSRQQLERILSVAMPHWINDHHGVQALAAFADLLHVIAGRATWLDLLATHQGALQWLIGVLSASRYLAEHIVKTPSWLEWPLVQEGRDIGIEQLCLNIQQLKACEDEAEFLAELGRLVDQARVLCALAVDAHTQDAIKIGAWLADVADAAVQVCLRFCVRELNLPDDFPLVALALGKHGSREMGLVSDLDMVFVLAGDADMCVHGRSYREWAQRVGRRLIRQLTSLPPFGAGYEFDGRLRPSGNSGVLVTTLLGFQDYQQHEAQTWEHQALCRARAITASEQLQEQVMAVIQKILSQKRDHQQLAQDVLCMRLKMLDHLASKDDGLINLKHDAGGLVDIEFLAQYACLAFASQKAGHYSTVQSLLQLPASAPKTWHLAAPMLAQSYLDYRMMENALRVELWQSIGKLPVDAGAPAWKTMCRHTNIHTPAQLKSQMQTVHQHFKSLL